jgi:exportin-T
VICLYFQKTYETSNPELVNQCLDVIGAYVAWIDIALVANDRFFELLLSLLHRMDSREAAADCLHDIISKGMEPLDKLQLVETLVSVLQSSGILKPLEVKIYVVRWLSSVEL